MNLPGTQLDRAKLPAASRIGKNLLSNPVSAAFIGALVALLCLSLTCPEQLPAEARSRKPAQSRFASATMTPSQKVLHTLNRFSFGPRPGDVANVSRMGVNAWFEQQLHPERLADTALTARLGAFPAMDLSQAELFSRFPSPQILRQYSQGALSAPDNPAERAIYADAGLRYQQRAGAKMTQTAQLIPLAAASPNASLTRSGNTSGAVSVVAGKLPPETPAAMDRGAVERILTLLPGDRMPLLMALSPVEMESLGAALRGNDETRLVQGLSPMEVEQVAAMRNPLRVVGEEVMTTRLLRDVYSERQLQAVMTDFWLNHFNVYEKKDQDEPYLLPAYERDAVLPHALGHFEDLLVAVAHSPAMLMYLDNAASIGPNSVAAQGTGRTRNAHSIAQPTKAAAKPAKGINENYARELMELHTLGVNGGYTQQDVIEVAKCFTGWGVARPAEGGGFVFNPKRHEPGEKTVLGHVIPEGGEGEGLAVLHLLATSPATAHLLSLQLAQRFVSDTPPASLVNRMTAAYLRSDGAIATVLSTLFHAPEFWSPAVYRVKVKTPLEFLVSALRAGDAEVGNPVPLAGALNRLGMPLYGMQTPNGYGWLASDWVSTSALLARMNFALVLSGEHLPGTRLAWGEAIGAVSGQSESPDTATETRLEITILGQTAALHTHEAVLQQARDPDVQRTAEQGFATLRPAADRTGTPEAKSIPRLDDSRRRPGGSGDSPLNTMAGLLLGSPDFQRR